MNKKLTEMFSDVFFDAGTLFAQCGCGIVYFSGDSGDLDEVEREELLIKAKESPSEYINVGNESVSLADVAGCILVYQCDCGRAKWFEDFIWGERRRIIDYLKRRSQENLKKSIVDFDLIFEEK
jgi:hypothetical protein